MCAEMPHQGVIVAVAGHDDRFVIAGPFDHRFQHQIRVHIALGLVSPPLHHRLELEIVPKALELLVERGSGRHIAEEIVRRGDVILLLQMNAEFLEIEQPAEAVDASIEILAVDQGNCRHLVSIAKRHPDACSTPCPGIKHRNEAPLMPMSPCKPRFTLRLERLIMKVRL